MTENKTEGLAVGRGNGYNKLLNSITGFLKYPFPD
jgi:hypothetical protein